MKKNIHTCIKCNRALPRDKEHFYQRKAIVRTRFDTACKKCRVKAVRANTLRRITGRKQHVDFTPGADLYPRLKSRNPTGEEIRYETWLIRCESLFKKIMTGFCSEPGRSDE